MSNFKRNFLIIWLFLIITFPAYKALFKEGMFTSHDGEGHIIRMFEFNNALNDGNFPVRWSKRLNWGLGYPFFNFNYPLPYYLSYLLSKTGLGLLNSYKTILFLSFPLGSFFTYIWLKKHFSKTASFIAGLFYTLIPYHFLNVYVRGNIAETLALTFIPLGFYLTDNLSNRKSLKVATYLGLLFAIIILSHNISAMLFLPVYFIYFFLNNGLSRLKYLLFSTVISLSVTCFFWLPALINKQIIIIDQVFPLYYAKQFPDIKDLIYSPWGFGGSKTGLGQMSVQIGLLHLLTLGITNIILLINLKKIKTYKIAFFFFSLIFLAFFIMTVYSKPLWDILIPLQYLQFPWRLLSFIALSVTYLSAFALSFIFKSFSRKISLLLTVFIIGMLLFFNRNHWRVNEYYPLPPYWFVDTPYGSTTTVDGEHTPLWQKENSPNDITRFKVMSGDAIVENETWKTNYHLFEINAKTDSLILDRTVYFPGWTVFIDGVKTETLDPYNKITNGLVGFNITKGKHKVEVKLLEPGINKISNAISILGIALSILIMTRGLRWKN